MPASRKSLLGQLPVWLRCFSLPQQVCHLPRLVLLLRWHTFSLFHVSSLLAQRSPGTPRFAPKPSLCATGRAIEGRVLHDAVLSIGLYWHPGNLNTPLTLRPKSTQTAMNSRDYNRPLPNSRRHALDRAGPDVTNRKDAAHRRLK
jgi:hypothetical protein